MKFYANISRQRLVEIEANTLEEANEQVQQGLKTILLDGLNPAWKTWMTVSAVKGESASMRYYVQRISEQLFYVRKRQAYRDEAGPDDRIVQPDIHEGRFDTFTYPCRVCGEIHGASVVVCPKGLQAGEKRDGRTGQYLCKYMPCDTVVKDAWSFCSQHEKREGDNALMEEPNQPQETILHIHKNGKETLFHGNLEALLKFVIANDLAEQLAGAHIEREERPRRGQATPRDERE